MHVSRILVVEDDDDISDVMRFFLEEESGMATFRAATGAEGIACLRSLPQLAGALIDIRLPQRGGFAVASEAAVCGVPALLMTGDFAEAEICETLGFSCLTKPFKLNVLGERVAHLVREKDRHLESLRTACLRLQMTTEKSELLVEQSKRLVEESKAIASVRKLPK